MAKGLPFLLEIGAEEIPDWMIVPALDHLRGAFSKLLDESKLDGSVEWVDGTPRRLVLRAAGLPKGQKDRVELVTGPPKAANEQAVQGFARKQGIAPELIKSTTTQKGEFWAFEKKIAGRAMADIFAEALPGLILGIPWPKAMYWTGKGGPRFIRPIRWLIALLGSKVVEFEVAGVKSGKIGRGHRRFGKQ
jgi:glycyl-tRNA synthetase beta chain